MEKKELKEGQVEVNADYDPTELALEYMDKLIKDRNEGRVDTGVRIKKKAWLIDFDSILLHLYAGRELLAGSNRTIPDLPPKLVISKGIHQMIDALMGYNGTVVFMSARPERMRKGVLKLLDTVLSSRSGLVMGSNSLSHSRTSFKEKAILKVQSKHEIALVFDNVLDDYSIYKQNNLDVCSTMTFSLSNRNEKDGKA